MKNLLTHCFCPLLCLAALTGCANQGAAGCDSRSTALDVDLTNRLYPKVQTPTESLVVVNLAKDDIEGQVAAIGLQGIINRDSREKVYVMNSRCKDNHGGWKIGPTAQAQMGQFWLDRVLADIPQQVLPLDTTRRNPAFRALVERYRDRIKGVVIYDPELVEATIEAATTIAAQTDALILSPSLYEQVKSYGFPVVEDLRGRFRSNIECLDWLMEHYFEGACHDVAFTWSHMTLDFAESWGAANKDYVVANRLFTYFLDIRIPEECHYYENIVKRYPAGTQIMGWTDELKADKLFADYGYVMVPFISVENMTVMSSFPSVQGTPIEPRAYEADPNTTYVAMLVADGDNLLHTMIYEPYTIEESEHFGEIPLTWVINPGIVDLAPRVFTWYDRVLKGAGQEMAAMMGDGSPNTDRYSGFSFYCALTRHYLDRAGILTMKQMIDGESVAWNVQPYCIEGGYAGTDWRGIEPHEYHMDHETFHIGTTNSRPEYLDRALARTPEGEPYFLSVMIGTASEDAPTYALEVKRYLESRNDGRRYVFVRTADLAATYRAWKGLPVM